MRVGLGGILSTPTTRPVSASDWEIHSHQDKELVKGLGLTSATMLVMGSMIGSGIFIVSAEIGREVDSPALLIAAWAVAGSVLRDPLRAPRAPSYVELGPSVLFRL